MFHECWSAGLRHWLAVAAHSTVASKHRWRKSVYSKASWSSRSSGMQSSGKKSSGRGTRTCRSKTSGLLRNRWISRRVGHDKWASNCINSKEQNGRDQARNQPALRSQQTALSVKDRTLCAVKKHIAAVTEAKCLRLRVQLVWQRSAEDGAGFHSDFQIAMAMVNAFACCPRAGAAS